MQANSTRTRNERIGIVASTLGLLATFAAGIACIGPLAAILLGLGGFGWLTRYAFLRVPAALLSLLLVGVGLYCAFRLRGVECAKPTRLTRWVRRLAWLAVVFAAVVHATEFVIVEHLF